MSLFNETQTSEGFICMDVWRKFKWAELNKIMRQKDSEMFVKWIARIGKLKLTRK